MRTDRRVLCVVAVLVGMGSAVAAQEGPATLCRETACRLAVDWKNGLPTLIDRRYGNPHEFERRLRGHLESEGYSLVVGAGGASEDAITLRVQPELVRAMCDITPGVDTDMTCQTIGEVRVEFLNVDPELDMKHSLRIRGRCGADHLMDVERMSVYVAAMIDYELHRGEDRRRPPARC